MNIYVRIILTVIFSVSVAIVSAQSINVDAGEDTAICYSGSLDLSSLGATISGAVDNGRWFTQGDGYFMPQNTKDVRYSEAQYYQPGRLDRQNGSIRLMLVSDDPDGPGFQTEVSDEVIINLMQSPALVCNNGFTLSLPEQCMQKINVSMLLANPSVPHDMYTIKLYDENGTQIDTNTVTYTHLGQTLRYVVGHECTYNVCEGTFSVIDNIPPIFSCFDQEVSCLDGFEPDSVGLPIPHYAKVYKKSSSTYYVEDWDGCGLVELSYADKVVHLDCQNGFEKRIERSWSAEDPQGNRSSCVQNISVKAIGLDSVKAPQNYDDITLPALVCGGDWKKLTNGYPSPETTGYPETGGCTKIEKKYTDTHYPSCGSSFKILRSWLLIDWCTSQNTTMLQIIAVKDKQGPMIEHQEDITIGTQAYTCVNEPYTVPFDNAVQDCSDWTYSIKLYDEYGRDLSVDHIQSKQITDLSVGQYALHYALEDACGNVTNDTTVLRVIDDIPPYVVCDEHTKVSVSSNGIAILKAESVDDGSRDNCGIVKMEVRKMTSKCGASEWSDIATFCCEEIGDTIMVEFRVTDAAGLSNTCMVEVRVEDKLPPVLVCPSDITISCSYDYDPNDLSVFGTVRADRSQVKEILIYDSYNKGVAGKDGYYVDNCEATLNGTSIVNVDCGKGTITRTWTATDKSGRATECTQTVTVIRDKTMSESNIDWPTEHITEGCDTLSAGIELTGKPTYRGLQCSRAQSTHEDQVFYLAGDACIKVLRHWTVIDWCQYDQNTGDGLWKYTQVIKIHNSEPPTINDCEDKVICDYDDCGTHALVLTLDASDDCTDSTLILYKWEIDLNSDGVKELSGTGKTIERDITYGTHHVYWLAEDKCGNVSRCDYSIHIKDCKLPTPYCRSSISSVIMPSTGELTIRAKDFDLSASDNCTSADDLKFSFSKNISDTTKVLTCADIENGIVTSIPLEIWVTDAAGNQDYCSVSMLLQDNSDVCQDGTFVGNISGRVYTNRGYEVSDVEMRYDCIMDKYSGSTSTADDGGYSATPLPAYLDYSVTPSYTGGIKDDVNSIDLVKIQRHILELGAIDSPYDIIAADVNGNKKIQASDLLVLRKYILGLYKEYPRVSKWVFVDKKHTFQDPQKPFDFPSNINIKRLDGSKNSVDFIAIRMGNVDGDYTRYNDEKSTSRSAIAIPLKVKKEGMNYSFYAVESFEYEAIQLELAGTFSGFTSELIEDEAYAIHDKYLKLAHIALNGRVEQGQLLFSVTTDAPPSVNTSSFIYNEGDSQPVELRIQDDANDDEKIVIYENPFSETARFHLRSVDQSKAWVQILDIQGQVLAQSYFETNQDIQLPKSATPHSGAYILKATFSDGTESVEKLIKY